jgi:hypothetical protein
MEFYGPVETLLKEKTAPGFGRQAKEILEKEFEFTLSEDASKILNATVGVDCAKNQFAQIIKYMSGKQLPPDGSNIQPAEEEKKPDDVKCMIIIYEGENAIKKIRDVLGPTDPLHAPEGTVRREFGSSIMVNTAHASDSTESYNREKDIVKVDKNSLVSIIREQLG